MLSKLGRFEIKGVLGRGAMGEVYLGIDPVLGREVAIKTILASPQSEDHARQRFSREARAAAMLTSPNIVTIHELGEDQGMLFIAMERLKGQDLEQILLQRNLSLPEFLDVLAQVCDGLDCAHRNNIIHRDIKPSNIMVMREGRRLHVKIMDFGVARLKDSAMTVSGTVMGTVNYIAPEYIKGTGPDPRSDLFAVGVMLYECISGRKPFDGPSTSDVLYKIVNDPPDPLELSMLQGLNPALRNMTEKALAKDPDERFQSGEEFAAVLRDFRNPAWKGKPGGRPEGGTVQRPSSPSTATPTVPLGVLASGEEVGLASQPELEEDLPWNRRSPDAAPILPVPPAEPPEVPSKYTTNPLLLPPGAFFLEAPDEVPEGGAPEAGELPPTVVLQLPDESVQAESQEPMLLPAEVEAARAGTQEAIPAPPGLPGPEALPTVALQVPSCETPETEPGFRESVPETAVAPEEPVAPEATVHESIEDHASPCLQDASPEGDRAADDEPPGPDPERIEGAEQTQAGSPLATPGKPPRTRKGLVAALVVLALAMVGGVLYFFGKPSTGTAEAPVQAPASPSQPASTAAVPAQEAQAPQEVTSPASGAAAKRPRPSSAKVKAPPKTPVPSQGPAPVTEKAEPAPVPPQAEPPKPAEPTGATPQAPASGKPAKQQWLEEVKRRSLARENSSKK